MAELTLFRVGVEHEGGAARPLPLVVSGLLFARYGQTNVVCFTLAEHSPEAVAPLRSAPLPSTPQLLSITPPSLPTIRKNRSPAGTPVQVWSPALPMAHSLPARLQKAKSNSPLHQNLPEPRMPLLPNG